MHRPPDADVYALLGVSRTAGDADLRRAYRRAARAAHPDAGGPEHAFHALQAAWDLVSTPERRAAYDAGRAQPLGAAPLALPGRAPEGWPASMLDRRSGEDRRTGDRMSDRRRPARRFTRPAVEVPVRFARFDQGVQERAPQIDARA